MAGGEAATAMRCPMLSFDRSLPRSIVRPAAPSRCRSTKAQRSDVPQLGSADILWGQPPPDARLMRLLGYVLAHEVTIYKEYRLYIYNNICVDSF
jgi:hypothetical protein